MPNRKNLFALFLLTLLATGSVIAAERREVAPFTVFGTPENSTQQQAVENLLDAFKETWATQNVPAHVALFAQDAEWINAYARMFRGTSELEIFLRDQLFPAFDSRVSQEEIRNAKLVSIRYLGDDAAVVHLYTDGSRGESAIPGQEQRRTHIHLVFAEVGAQWKIAHTAIMDARN
ncbi:MAG: hypothetical protein COB20_06395 [SAR86 cluster bacterium]|uniref:DUF4440 domain-containing protein n=1 Tax=SAR86 cluster bacterium TaxID=2030880 RepID=A0A2A4X926_9GAMM|nr:MAG: hypothetical protein COB20_06395 [SAR86 cluster bacterium]